MDRGLLDAAEFNNPSSDIAARLPGRRQGLHAAELSPAVECFEVIFNKDTLRRAWRRSCRRSCKYAAVAASADMSWKCQDRYSEGSGRDQGAPASTSRKTPDAVLEAQLAGLGQGDRRAGRRRIRSSPRCWNRRRRGSSAWSRFDASIQRQPRHGLQSLLQSADSLTTARRALQCALRAAAFLEISNLANEIRAWSARFCSSTG